MTLDKHLLMIVPFFPPNAGGGVYRPLGFVKYLHEYGWRTTVIAPQADQYWLHDDTLTSQIPHSCEVHRTDALSGQWLLSRVRPRSDGPRQVRSSKGFSFLRKMGATLLVPDTYLGWRPFAERKGREVLALDRFDAIYSTSPPETSHLVAHTLHRESGLPWVADFRDPWMNLDLFAAPTPLHRRMHARLERKVCDAAAVVVTSRWHEALLRERYPALERLRVISNGYDHEAMPAPAAITVDDGPLRIVHTGMLTQKRSAVPFLRGLRRFIDRSGHRDVAVKFFGPRESENDEEVSRLQLADVVEFHDSVSHTQSLNAQSDAHILLLIKHLDPVYAGVVPGKIYEYFGMERPILGLVPEGEAADLIRQHRRGEVASQSDPDAITHALTVLYERYRAGALASAYDLSRHDEFTRQALTGQLAEYIDDTIRNEVTS